MKRGRQIRTRLRSNRSGVPPPRSNAARTRRTRRALLAAGRTVLTEQGYARTTIAAIIRRVGVTRGAFYHYYPDKTALFAAVFAEVCQESLHAVRTRMRTAAGDPWERLVASLGVLLEQLGHPSVQRIVYMDGPMVLGRSAYRQWPDQQFLRSVLAQLQAEGGIGPGPLDLRVHLVRGMCFEAALYIVQAEERAVARQEVTVALLRLLGGLRPPQTVGDRENCRP